MKISLSTTFKSIDDLSPQNGYGYATDRMLNSLSVLGYDWSVNSKDTDVEIVFDQPHNIRWRSKNSYKIAYHPWESTQLLPGRRWQENLNSADEVWTPSPLIADWYKRYMGVVPPVYVYEHGVDPIWAPVEREINEKFRFLHVGFEGLRKGGKETIHAFRRAFPNNPNVELTLKTTPSGWKIGYLRGITVLNQMMDVEGLVSLFHNHHAYVYPSWGEGFGLTPLQAMATGMPTITVPAWAPYEKFLDPQLSIDSRLTRSPYPAIHPGMMFQPNVDDLIDRMRYTYDNYYSVRDSALSRVDEITAYYDWHRLTKEAFSALEERLKSR